MQQEFKKLPRGLQIIIVFLFISPILIFLNYSEAREKGGLFQLFLVVGIIALIVWPIALALKKGKSWARATMIVLSIGGIITTLVQTFFLIVFALQGINPFFFFNIVAASVSLAIHILIIWYLRKNEIKRLFGKSN